MVQIIAENLDQYYEKVSELRRLPYVWSIQSSVAIKEVDGPNQYYDSPEKLLGLIQPIHSSMKISPGGGEVILLRAQWTRNCGYKLRIWKETL